MAAVESWREHDLGPCACSQLRRASRVLSALYDEFLAPASITVTQYAILVNIARQPDGVSRTSLAALLGMDRTTLTRNLRPLARTRLVGEKVDPADHRSSVLRLTRAGYRKLDRAFALWAKVQQDFANSFGPAQLEHLRDLLSSATFAAQTVRGSGSPDSL